jgi:hypothetical protein
MHDKMGTIGISVSKWKNSWQMAYLLYVMLSMLVYFQEKTFLFILLYYVTMN